jgi:hypothetical protein
MGMLANAVDSDRREIPRGVKIMTAGAAPPFQRVPTCAAMETSCPKLTVIIRTLFHHTKQLL